MKQILTLSSVPADEPCAQVGTEGYDDIARRECHVFKEQLMRLYRTYQGSDLPPECRLVVKTMDHDFGCYYEVVIKFDDDNKRAVDAAYWLENNVPVNWDNIAKQQLSNEKHVSCLRELC